ncbi:MAG: endonuclease MutS2, partial [Saprospiraceae bacterium]
VIDEEGNIRPNASPELLKIHKLTISKQKELDSAFRRVIAKYRDKGWLTDNLESVRNGRRVLSVPSEHKRKIRGIIHDESATGRTTFIEPEEIIDINNDIFDLQQSYRREIYRILRDLSRELHPYVPTIRAYQKLIIRFDVIQAKAMLATKMRGEMPKLFDRPHLGIQMGYHPLLYLKNKAAGKVTVPFDMQLFGANRMLILSGPNAGGKSITMKSVGLMQLMVQAGMLVPVDEISEFGLFKKIFADIGDQQSLEDELSTYSSRLRNAKTFLDNADDQTLVLIDEFGSGTDPKIGGAIAEAILKELNDRKVSAVITTHYSNLKIFAFKNKGIVNGSMTFNSETLSPTYEFRVGRPGSSYAFEIAQKSGLGKKILNYAKHRTGKNEKAVDQLLVDLQREKQELEDKLSTATSREKKLEKLIKNYEGLHRELEFKRKKLKLEIKEQNLQATAKDNKELERVIRELRENKNLEKAKEVAAKVREERQELVDQVEDLKEDIYYKPEALQAAASSKKGPIKAGDHVRFKRGGSTGTIESIDRKKAIVAVGQMRMTVNLRDLEHANAPLEIKSTKSISLNTVAASANFESKIDIRGMRMEEAIQVVEDFVDQALMASATNLRIVHGKGNGVLRKVVKKKLREYDAVDKIYHPEAQAGGDGVTLVEMG